jgi:prepilin-type N-terminal cleavage/methylation domain-containing protein
MTNRRGFTLVELLIALVLLGIVGTALYQLLVSNQRLYEEQTQRVQVNESARAAISLLPGELRELNAADTAESDIVAMTPTSLTYKAMRGLYVLCQAPNSGGLQVTVNDTLFYGVRRLEPTQDSVLIFWEGDPDTRTDDGWLHANVTSAVAGNACPGGGQSLQLQLSGVSSTQLDGVTVGAPLRNFEVAQALVYADAAGDQWLGGRLYLKAAGTWSGTQPIVGPLSATGLQLAYYDATGAVTGTPASVARVGITVQSRSARAVTRTPTGFNYLLQNLMTHVALRNNPN